MGPLFDFIPSIAQFFLLQKTIIVESQILFLSSRPSPAAIHSFPSKCRNVIGSTGPGGRVSLRLGPKSGGGARALPSERAGKGVRLRLIGGFRLRSLLRQPQQILAILVLAHGFGEGAELVGGDPALAEGDGFEAGDLQAGAFLDGLDEDRGFGEGVVGAGVEPGEAAAQGLDLEFAVGQECLVDGGDLQLAAGAGLDMFGDVDHFVRVEVQAHDGVVALRVGRFLFDGEAVAGLVEFGDAVAFGVGYPVAEDGGFPPRGVGDGLLEHRGEAAAVEDVVAEDETDTVVADELLADDEGLRQAVGTGLLGIFEAHTVVGSVAQQAAEARQVVRRRDDQDVADTGQHQHADGIIDHRLVVDGQQLFADAFGDRVESGAGAAGQDDAFHVIRNKLYTIERIGGGLRGAGSSG